ncbi:MAG TPA: aspartyl/asparaginyl beta-hydroxylase domain-containing protein [Rhizomicrobium sp.]|nr:aspartyl/asparaginyl beta-hydroxylase domain-containing protein [Rhizomicrobium sp.]
MRTRSPRWRPEGPEALEKPRALIGEGNAALRRGEPSVARDCFERAAALDPREYEAWLGIALAIVALGDPAKAHAAADRALGLAPRSFRALLAKADICAADGNARAASSFYTAAIRAAPPQTTPEFQAEIRRAQAMCERYASEYESFLRDRLAAAGFDPAHSSARFQQSLDLMMGRKRIFLQQPQQYYFPGLPQIQFYERAMFPWLDAVEAATDDIAAELRDVLKTASAFRPYVEEDASRPRRDDDRMTNNQDWTAFYLRRDGQIVEEHAARCPKTMRVLEHVPLCTIPGRTPSVLFSQLRAGARIPPHTGYINARLICHLPLIVPGHCGFRVGNDVRAWEKGEAWVFDDTIEHEAWNDSGETRVILLFEIWRPELSEEERMLVSALMQAVDAQGGAKTRWTA